MIFSQILTYLHINYLDRLLLSILAGVLIGLDREIKKKPTGIRTCSMITLGACLFSVLTQVIPASYPDRGHLVANIPQGIGVICMGAVLVQGKQIIGLTSAALLWVSAAIGIAIGFGCFGLAFISVGLILMVIKITDYIQHRGLIK